MGDRKEQGNDNNEKRNVNTPLINQAKKENEALPFRRKLGILEYANIVLSIAAIASLILIYYMTTEQNRISLESLRSAETSNLLTRESLKRADTSNLLTRESLEFTKRSTLSSDSSTRKSLSFTRQSLNIAESSFTVSKKMLKVSEITMVTTNTPYIQIRPKLGEIQKDYYGYIIMFRNVGNTPALSLRGKIGTEIADRDNPNRPIDESEYFRLVSLPPKDSIFLRFDTVKVNQEIFTQMWMRKNTLRIYGFFEYEDIFNYQYQIKFSYYWDPDNDSFLIPKEGNSYKRIN